MTDDSLPEIAHTLQFKLEQAREREFDLICRVFEMEQAVVAHMQQTDHPEPPDEMLWHIALGYERSNVEE